MKSVPIPANQSSFEILQLFGAWRNQNLVIFFFFFFGSTEALVLNE